jgi:hypothetical protein
LPYIDPLEFVAAEDAMYVPPELKSFVRRIKPSPPKLIVSLLRTLKRYVSTPIVPEVIVSTTLIGT